MRNQCHCPVPQLNHNDPRKIHGSICVTCGKKIILEAQNDIEPKPPMPDKGMELKPYDRIHNKVRAKLLGNIEPKPYKNTLCWIYKGYRNISGYGRLRMNGKKVLAHRAMWELFEGEIPKGMCLLHICDRPACINPAHLFFGTNKDNVQDAIKKGRRYRVMNSPFTKGHKYYGRT